MYVQTDFLDTEVRVKEFDVAAVTFKSGVKGELVLLAKDARSINRLILDRNDLDKGRLLRSGHLRETARWLGNIDLADVELVEVKNDSGVVKFLPMIENGYVRSNVIQMMVVPDESFEGWKRPKLDKQAPKSLFELVAEFERVQVQNFGVSATTSKVESVTFHEGDLRFNLTANMVKQVADVDVLATGLLQWASVEVVEADEFEEEEVDEASAKDEFEESDDLEEALPAILQDDVDEKLDEVEDAEIRALLQKLVNHRRGCVALDVFFTDGMCLQIGKASKENLLLIKVSVDADRSSSYRRVVDEIDQLLETAADKDKVVNRLISHLMAKRDLA